ncbi:glycosyltransferase family 32 protein [Bacteroides fragilis]|uniref:glycosyltransferase family 32 protein n=1 Tax=Bacteroides fragilis TaxID=817 RepID=UPI0022E1757F|nr:glycosyltransferase [Bacteroides fragilis]
MFYSLKNHLKTKKNRQDFSSTNGDTTYNQQDTNKMNTLTIPKTIHYCWFGKNDLPPLVKKCIKSWHKYLPDYEFKLWDEQSFDITSNKWCQEAYKQKKYAFVADYVRLKVLYEQGGIYLDTDIQLYKSLNPFLSNEAFMGFERNEILSMGGMGFKKNNKIIKELLDYYDQEFNLNIVNKLESNAVNSTLAVSNIRNRTYTDYEVYLIDYGYGNFKEKIHFME